MRPRSVRTCDVGVHTDQRPRTPLDIATTGTSMSRNDQSALSRRRRKRAGDTTLSSMARSASTPIVAGTWDAAFAAVSRTPAEIFGAGSQVGRLERNYQADVVIWDGDPLQVTSAPDAVFIEGVEQPLTSRQTLLRDRYHPSRRAAR